VCGSPRRHFALTALGAGCWILIAALSIIGVAARGHQDARKRVVHEQVKQGSESGIL